MQILGIFDKANFATDFLLGLFAILDSLIYNLVVLITEGIFNVANTQIFAEGVINEFTQRVYVILGVFMLFKISFSLLNAVVNPDALTDKEKGMQKIVPRIIMVLIMLIIVPPVFNAALRIQGDVVQAIPALIIGRKVDNSGSTGKAMGESIAQQAFSTFVVPRDDVCSEGNAPTLEKKPINEIRDAITSTCSDTKDYRYSYTFLVSTAVGIVMAFILLGYTIDIAIRAMKLGILQLLAPIPIVSYIDPKSSKDGAFAHWSKTVISTYLDLFIKMAIIYFVIFVLSEIIQNNGLVFPEGINPFAQGYVVLFLILGLLFFARQAPKFIGDMLGVKNVGGGSGLSGAIAAGAALIGGAGLAGAGAAFMQAGQDAAEAAVQGKQAPPAWSKGRDLAAKIKTGDKDAVGGVANMLQRNAQKSGQKKQAANLGLSENTVKAAKDNAINEKNKARAMALALENDELSYTDATGTHSFADKNALMSALVTQEGTAAKAETKAADMKEAFAAYGQKKSYFDKNHETTLEKGAFGLVNRYQANRATAGRTQSAVAAAAPTVTTEGRATRNQERIDRRP